MTPPFAFYPQQQPCRTKDLIERKPFCKVSSASNRRVGVSTRFRLSEMEMAATSMKQVPVNIRTARHITNPGAGRAVPSAIGTGTILRVGVKVCGWASCLLRTHQCLLRSHRANSHHLPQKARTQPPNCTSARRNKETMRGQTPHKAVGTIKETQRLRRFPQVVFYGFVVAPLAGRPPKLRRQALSGAG